MSAIPDGRATNRTGPIFTVLLLGTIASVLNQTILNVALPDLAEAFAVSTSTVQWLITTFMLVNGIFIPVTAYLLNRFSTRQLFFFAMISFAAGSFMCGLAPNFLVLLMGRIVQALGAGVMMPLLVNVVFRIFPKEKRGAAMGIAGLAITFAPAFGPTLSGFLLTYLSWQYIFFINLPLSVGALVAAFFILKNVNEPQPVRLDGIGVVASTLGFGGLLYGFGAAGEYGWGSLYVVGSILLGVISLILFVVRQFRTDSPLIDLRIFKSVEFSLSVLIIFFANCVFYAIMIVFMIYLISSRGLTAMDAGFINLIGSIVMAMLSPIAGRLFDRYGMKWLGLAGAVSILITCLMYSNLTSSTSIFLLVTGYIIRSVGIALLAMPIMTAGLNALQPELQNPGTAMQNTIQAMAGATGTAVMATVMSMQTNRAVSAGSTMDDAHLYGVNSAFLVSAAFSVVALAATAVWAFGLHRQKYDAVKTESGIHT